MEYILNRSTAELVNRLKQELLAEEPSVIELYGDSGTGKTAMMQYLAEELHIYGKSTAIFSAAKYQRELMEAIQSNNLAVFSRRFRENDVIVLDNFEDISSRNEATMSDIVSRFESKDYFRCRHMVLVHTGQEWYPLGQFHTHVKRFELKNSRNWVTQLKYIQYCAMECHVYPVGWRDYWNLRKADFSEIRGYFMKKKLMGRLDE